MRNAAIPDLWRLVRLRDVTEDIRYGINEPNAMDGQGPRFLRISDVNDDGELTSKSPARLIRKSADLGRYRVQFGDLLLARSGSVGRSFVAPQDFSDWVFASYFIRFRLRLPLVDPVFAGFFCRSPLFKDQVARIARVVAQPNVNSGEFAEMLFPLPPLSEQQRIVGLLQEAEEIRRLRAEAQAKTAELAPAMFEAVFGVPSEWKGGPKLGELVKIVGGGTPSRSVGHYYSGRIPWATSKDIKKLYLDDTEEHVTEEAVQSSATNIVPAGTVLVVVKSKILAHSLPVAITQVPMCFGQDIKGLIPTSDITPEFFVYSLQAQLGRILSRARGANTEGLTLEAIKSLNMPKPSPKLIERFRIACDEIRSLEKASIASNRMTFLTSASLSAHAFSGQLTADWREAHRERLAIEARERDAALKEAGATFLRSRRETIQEMEAFFQDRTEGIYSELNREQRVLLRELNRMVGGVRDARYFSAKMLNDYISEEPLRRNPQAIEEHLAVLAARGLIVPVSREEQTEDTGEFVFGNAYRLTLRDLEPREGEEGEPRKGVCLPQLPGP
jgi:type I restriction enzyme S subunit